MLLFVKEPMRKTYEYSRAYLTRPCRSVPLSSQHLSFGAREIRLSIDDGHVTGKQPVSPFGWVVRVLRLIAFV